MSNANHQVDPMDHGIITPNRTERRLSLPARVNVLVVDGQNYAQVSNLLRKNFKQRGNGEKQSSEDQQLLKSSGAVGDTSNSTNSVVNKSSLPSQYLSLSAIPEDIEHSDESLEETIADMNNITVHSKDGEGFCLEEQQIVDDEDEIELVDPAPDGGYGWVIVLASFMCNLVVDGIAYTFGLFFHYFVNHFGASKGKTALAGSLLSGCYMSAGPIVSALTNRWGCRAVTMAGSVVSCIAFLLSAISPNIDCLLITYGVLGGIGFGLIYLPAIVSVGYYFTSKRAFATGIAVCGSGVGAFVFAPLCQLALSYYDWRGTLVLQAGLALNCAVFGALMRPLNVEAETYYDETEDDDAVVGTDEKAALLSANKSGDSYELTTNTEPGVQSVNDLNHIKVITPAEMMIVESILAKEKSTAQNNDPSSLQVTIDPPEKESVISMANELLSPDVTEKVRCQSSAAELGPHPDNNMNRTRARSAIGIGRFTGSRAFSDVNPPPLHIVLSSNPMSSSQNIRRKSSAGVIAQSIAVRPLSKKDIFYSGSSTSVNRRVSISSKPQAQQEANLIVPDSGSGNKKSNLNRASVVSIPARDVIEQVNREKEKIRAAKDKKSGNVFSNLNGKISNYFCCFASCNGSKVPKNGTSSNKIGNNNNKKKKRKMCCETPKIMKEMVDFSLLREEPSFLLLSISNVFGFMGYYIPFVYIIQHLTTQVVDPSTGTYVSREKAALILSTIGITNTIGRIIFGWISDKVTDPDKNYTVTALFINNVCLIIAGLSVMAIPFLTSFYSILFGAIVFGSFISAYISLTSIIIVELVGLDKLTNAFGSICMFRGAAAMMGPPLAGSIYDFTGSFDLTFYAAGILLILSSLTSFLIPSQFKEKTK